MTVLLLLGFALYVAVFWALTEWCDDVMEGTTRWFCGNDDKGIISKSGNGYNGACYPTFVKEW